MPDGNITFSTDLDTAKLEKKLSRITEKIESIERDIAGKQQARSPWAETVERLVVQLDAAKAKLFEMQNASKGTFSAEQINAQKETVNSLQHLWDSAQSQVEKYDRQIASAEDKLKQQKEKAAKVTDEIAEARKNQEKLGSSVDGVSIRFSSMKKRIESLAASALFFSVITKGLTSLRDWMGTVIKSSDEASAALSRMKGALLTMVQPLVNAVIPAFITFINILTRVVNFVSQVISKFSKKSSKQYAKEAKALYDKSNAIGAVGAAAKKASKDLASFDEINKLSGDQDTGGSGGGSSDAGIAPDFTGQISQNLNAIEAIAGGLLLAIGAILAFSGANIGLGLGLMAAGALILAPVIQENWEAIQNALEGPIGIVFGIVSAALLVLGAVIAFSGAHIGLGIGLMILGASGLATVAAVNWDSIQNALEGPIGVVEAIMSVALLVLGAIIAFSGAHIGLGIGLMILGAAGLATVVAVNWDSIQNALEGPIGAVVALVSGALLMLGAILAFTGANIPLGIGLMLAGAAGLAATAAVNWDSIVTALQGPIGTITAIVSGLLLILGIILLFTGAGIPLGLGLIAAGAVGMAAAIAPNWEFLKEKVQDAWESVKEFWDKHIAKYFTADFWKQLGKDMLNGLLESVENGLNWALSGAGKFVNGIIGVLNKIPGVDIGTVSWGNVKLPRLAQGAVIPPNREFMAVLGDQKHGTNIEAPLETIQEAVASVMDDYASSNLAGQEAIVGILREILEAVLGVQIGDDVIGQACDRYRRKMAVVNGGLT